MGGTFTNAWANPFQPDVDIGKSMPDMRKQNKSAICSYLIFLYKMNHHSSRHPLGVGELASFNSHIFRKPVNNRTGTFIVKHDLVFIQQASGSAVDETM